MTVAQDSTLAVIEGLLAAAPFGMGASEKHALYGDALSDLTRYHAAHCEAYRRMLSLLGYGMVPQLAIEAIPFIPVRMFKEYKLASVAENEISRTMTSSGTTGQAVSRIISDRTNAINQTKVLVRIMSSVLGEKRLPLLVIDSPAVLKIALCFRPGVRASSALPCSATTSAMRSTNSTRSTSRGLTPSSKSTGTKRFWSSDSRSWCGSTYAGR